MLMAAEFSFGVNALRRRRRRRRKRKRKRRRRWVMQKEVVGKENY